MKKIKIKIKGGKGSERIFSMTRPGLKSRKAIEPCLTQ
jgi:hypothetical protein